MKQKLIIKSTGKPVEVGDIIEVHYHQVKKDGTTIVGVSKNTLTEKNIPRFIKRGILAVQTFGEPTGYEEVPTSIKYYINKVIKSLTSDCNEAACFRILFSEMLDVYPFVIFQLLLRQVAIELDQRYEGDISKCETVYVIESTGGRVIKMSRKNIKNFRNFSAFRTEKDAEFAKRVLDDYIKILYSGKQKD